MFPVGANGPNYGITKSLRFRNSASAYMDRTFGTPTNNKIWTWSGWIKRGLIGTNTQLIMNASISGDEAAFRFTNDNFQIYFGNGGVNGLLITTQVFRDPASFYHIVVAIDTTQATASNRVKIYSNGLQITSFSYEAYPVQNYNTSINAAGNNVISTNSSDALDGYLAEINFIDGQALTPSSFGSINTTTGVWQPAQYAGTYGANGFYLKFTDNSALTTTTNVGLGKDFSGNGNYWRTVNISLTAGITYDSMTDVPTLTNDNTSNFAVMNPLVVVGTTTFQNANLYMTGNSSGTHSVAPSTIAVSSGKFYAEFRLIVAGDNYPQVGIVNSTVNLASTFLGGQSTGYSYASGALKYNNGTSTAYGATYAINDWIGVAYDATAGSLTFYKNGVSQGVAFTGLSGSFYFAADAINNGQWAANFGQMPWAYSPPTNYIALNAYNLPNSTIVKGDKVMDATLYTGTGASLSVTNAGAFKPDLVWLKSRSAATSSKLTDSVRGVTKAIVSSTTAAETTDTQGLTAFGTGGFTVGTDTTYNNNTATYVGWQWQAGQGSSGSNTNGSITSTVSVNASAGFSVVTYTGTGANATVGHGLGVAPQFIIIKNRTGTVSWAVYHSAQGAGGYLILNDGAAWISDATAFNSTAPTSSVFSIGVLANVNTNTNNHVAYCWTPIAGYSAFGIYAGNGAASGTFVYTGFRPKFILLKTTLAIDNWHTLDTSRSPYNVADKLLYTNSDASEQTVTVMDIVSNGFKLRNASDGNSSGNNYIYAAFASNPFKNSLAF